MADHIQALVSNLQTTAESYRQNNMAQGGALLDTAAEAINAFHSANLEHISKYRELLTRVQEMQKLPDMLMLQSTQRLGEIQRLTLQLTQVNSRYQLLFKVLKRDGYWPAGISDAEIEVRLDQAILRGVADVTFR